MMRIRLTETLSRANGSVLVAVLICCHFHATGQVFSTLYSFSAIDNSSAGINIDGTQPQTGVILFGNTLYGTAEFGGMYGSGTVFALNADGSNFRTLYSFSGGGDGANPQGGSLISSGNTLYGTTGGSGNGCGTVFAVNTDGSGFTALYVFGQLANEAAPFGLVLLGDTLFGSAYGGCSIASSGAVFALNTNAMDFRNIYWWTDQNGGGPENLVLSDGILYGNSYGGVIYKLNTNGTDYAELHNFADSEGNALRGGLVLSGQTLYGVAHFGGVFDEGTLFKVNTDGTRFTNLYSFSANTNSWSTNSDGANPYGGLALLGNTLYGTTSEGGTSGSGTVFAINTDGTGFKVLHTFTYSDGALPRGDLFLSGNTLYGTTSFGGDFGNGTIFSILLPANPPQLTMARSGADFILSWPQQAEGFTLESTTDLASPNWTTNSVSPVIINGQYTVTNLVSGQQQFFRLAQ